LKSNILVFDRTSVRTIDQNGHLRVSLTNISKANVCPYFGKEIPGWKELGLVSDQVYQMFRHPDELEKAADTFNGVPLLNTHVPVYSDDHPKNNVVGSTGESAKFDGTYLKNSLVIWTEEAKQGIDSDQQREISCSYSYDADMTPGMYKGERYDGVMRNIRGNHVALVQQGRAGSDVLVADSLNQEVEEAMKKKVYSKSVLAQLAQDKKVEKVEDLLALLAADEEEETEEEKAERLKKEAESKKAEDEETEEEKADRLKKEAEAKKAEDEEESEAEKKAEEKKEKAMDEKIRAASEKAKAETKAEMRAMHEAVEIVTPWVGKMVAMDSAEEVYKAALDLKKVDVDGVHPSAYRALVKAHMASDQRPAVTHDAKTVKDMAEQFPGAARIKRR